MRERERERERERDEHSRELFITHNSIYMATEWTKDDAVRCLFFFNSDTCFDRTFFTGYVVGPGATQG